MALYKIQNLKILNMKKVAFFISIILIGTNNIFSQDTIPNPGFEDWTGGSPDQPIGWGTANAIHIQLNNCATKGTAAGDTNSGAAAIILTTVQVSGGGQTWRVAGTAVSGGQINQSYPFVSGGIPYALRPTFLRGFCKYLPQQSSALYNGNPVGIDVSNIQVTFTKWNGTDRDTIGQGQLSPSNNTYAAFAVPITFTTTAAPDTVQIVLASSKGLETAQGSKLYVDDLEFDFTVGLEELSLDKFDLKQNTPNPFTGSTSIQFNCTANEKVIFNVFDMLGGEVYSNTINATSGINTFTYTSKLSPGTYFYSISNGIDRVTKRMVVAE